MSDGGGACPLCHGSATELAFVIVGCRINRCRDCDLHFADPAGRAGLAYDREYFADGTPSAYTAPAARAARLKRLAPLANELGKPPAGGRALEFGAACGDFLMLLRGRGWQVSGVELSPFACNAARERYGLALANMPLEEYVPPAPFNLVVALDVFSHVTDPDRFFRKLANCCAPGGRIVVQTGDARRLNWWRRTRQWHDPREHAVMLSRRTLPHLESAYGMQLERIDYPTVLDAGYLPGTELPLPPVSIALTGKDRIKKVLLPLRPLLRGTAQRLFFRRQGGRGPA